MGYKDVDWAFTMNLAGPQKAVLLALAHVRNAKTGELHPSQKELAQLSGFALKTVCRSLIELEQKGVITRTKTAKGGYRWNDEYTLNYECQVVASATGGQSDRRSESPVTGGQSDRAVRDKSLTNQESKREARTARGTRIPDDFTVTPEMVNWARERCPLVDGRTSTERFINHFMSKTGRDATKLDWTRTWQNWLLKDQQDAERAPQRRTTDDKVAEWARLGRQMDHELKELTA